MNYQLYIILIVALPFAAFLLLGLTGKKNFSAASGAIATGAMALSAILSLITAYNYFFVYGKVNEVYRSIIPFHFTWLEFNPGVSIDMGALLDPISMMMIVVVTFVSLMVHLFSIGYMKGEERFKTYFAFLGLFTFSMLGLVLSSNIFQIYIFWELVGVSSYLLIGFYFQKPSAVAAAKKAFIVTRFADLGFLIGILILGFYGGTLDFGLLIERLTTENSAEYLAITTGSFLGISMLTWGLTLVFIGGAGKSAMFPLHIWLPDAMEGPTPVSALIHAATMVVAGVFLVARLYPVFILDITAMQIITWIGISSALFAAVIACTQTDIKKVLAYSTMSQIGFMMFALGISANDGSGYTGSMFHLFTHAFFKSLLFLGAGAVIHMVHSNEIKDMGGLRKLMPVTHLAFLVACLAIAGIPPFSGFFSKEEILLAAYNSNKVVYYIALFTAALTAFYMFRLYFSIFWKKEFVGHSNTPLVHEDSSSKNHLQHSHSSSHSEGTFSMKLPLVILTALSVATGFIPFSNYITWNGIPKTAELHIVFSIVPVALAIAAIALAARMYKKENQSPAKISEAFGGIYRLAVRKFYIDEMYLFITKKVIFNFIAKPAAWIDKHIVDGFMNRLASTTATVSVSIKGMQSGRVQYYAIYFLAGIIGLSVLFIYIWK
ncbi:MAG: NADH-quinone oxidoreductase subunit L [Flavitalea sp.]